ncbi:MAG: hypothetical protein ACLU4N_06165 [Butyricimonas faecihominis]
MEALRNYQEAGFSDEQNRYLYVNSYRESYLRDIMYDYFGVKEMVRELSYIKIV